MVEELLGLSTGWQKIEYTWRDMALYALAVGADENDLLYTYEKDMKALPSFGSLTYFNSVNVTPKRPFNYPSIFIARDHLRKRGFNIDTGLNLGHEMIMYRPIDPIKGTLVFEDTITDIYDWGNKGIIVVSTIPVYDEAGNLLCVNKQINTLPVGGEGHFPPMPKESIEYPKRTPDYIVNSEMSRVQNVIFRLTSDRDPHHIDPEIAKERMDRVFMQGLCSYGYACRMMINAVIPGEPEKMTKLSVQMRSVAYPGTKVQVQAWKIGSHTASFRLLDNDTGKAILNNCVFEWKE